MRKPFRLSADPREFFNIIIPGSDILVSDRPIDGNTFLCIRFKIHVTPAIALSSPGERAAANLVASYPVKRVSLDVRMVLIVYKKLLVPFIICETLNRVLFSVPVRILKPVSKIQWIQHGSGIVLYMLDLSSALQHQCFYTFFTNLFCRPAAADARTDDDGIVCITGICLPVQINILFRTSHMIMLLLSSPGF